jgi:hypothetical protein
MDHFDYAPIFTRRGGIDQARNVFQDDLESLVKAINYEIAA